MNVDIERALKITGWMSEVDLRWLAAAASWARIVVEIGCWEGRSTRAMADNLPPGGVLYAVDVWNGRIQQPDGTVMEADGAEVMASFMNNLDDHIKSGRVVVVHGDRHVALDALGDHAGEVDLVFIDGDHSYDSVIHDIEVMESVMAPKGIIAGHDYSRTEVRAAVQAAFHVMPRRVEEIWWMQA